MSSVYMRSCALNYDIWLKPPEVKVAWFTLLAMADEYGEIDACLPAIASACHLSEEKCLNALATLSSSACDGVRIVATKLGWRIVDHRHFIRLERDPVIAKRASRPVREISLSKRFSVLSRDGFACRYCGRKPPDVVLHVDHVTPVSSGGGNDPDNLVAACAECNLGKGDKLVTGAT